MPVEHGFRPRPFGRPNLSPDGVGGSGGKPSGDNPFTLLPGATPLGERIVKQRRQTEQPKLTLGEEINAYLDERARLRAQGLLPTPEDKPPIVTPADAIALDLFAYDLEVGTHPKDIERARSVSRIHFGFDALAFGLMSQAVQEYVTIGYEFGQGFFRNHPEILEESGRLNGEEAVILAEQLQKVGLPFQARPQGITIPFVPTVKNMREIAGGEPLFPHIPPPNLTHIQNHRRNR